MSMQGELMADILAIIEHAKETGGLPAGVCESKAAYLAGIVRAGIESKEASAHAIH